VILIFGWRSQSGTSSPVLPTRPTPASVGIRQAWWAFLKEHILVQYDYWDTMPPDVLAMIIYVGELPEIPRQFTSLRRFRDDVTLFTTLLVSDRDRRC